MEYFVSGKIFLRSFGFLIIQEELLKSACLAEYFMTYQNPKDSHSFLCLVKKLEKVPNGIAGIPHLAAGRRMLHQYKSK